MRLRSRLALALLLPALGCAHAIDLFNGVRVGAQLPQWTARVIGAAPPAERALTVIDFWATWCKPCVESITELNRLHRAVAPKGVVVLGVTQEPSEKAEAFLAQHPMAYFAAVDVDGTLHHALKIDALPYAIVVDRSQTVVWRGPPDALTPEELDRMLAQSARR